MPKLPADPAFKVATIRGVPLVLQLSFLLLPLWFGFVGWIGSGGGWRGGLYMAATMVLLYLLGLLHELGHILVARRFGATIVRVRVSGLGAFVQVNSQRGLLPHEEMGVAAAGPLVSALLALGLGIAAQLLNGPLTVMEAARAVVDLTFVGMLWMLAASSAFLALCNLLPIYPMDGGRIALACLGMWIEPVQATRVISAFGQLMAVAAVPAVFLATPNLYLRLSTTLSALVIFVLSRSATGAEGNTNTVNKVPAR
jgi:membrane-associated protease RseP (regulator of RpoE activity)